MYEGGVLKVGCLGLKCVDFNQDLYRALHEELNPWSKMTTIIHTPQEGATDSNTRKRAHATRGNRGRSKKAKANASMGNLPPEMGDRILDHLWTDHRALVACSLTCREWLPTTRLHMFNTITIDANTRLRFEETLEESPHLALYVRHLIAHVSPGSGLSEQIGVLSRLDNTADLTLVNWHVSSIDSETVTVVQNIRRLYLRRSSLGISDTIIPLLCAFPVLSELHIQQPTYSRAGFRFDLAVDWAAQSDTKFATLTLPESLRTGSLHLANPPIMLIQWLAEEQLQLSPTALHLSWALGNDPLCFAPHFVMFLSRLFRAAGSKLQHLTLSPVWVLRGFRVPWGLQTNDHLRSLHLDVTPFFERAHWVHQALQEITSHVLARIEIGFCFDCIGIDVTAVHAVASCLVWEDVDRCLARLAEDNPGLEIAFLLPISEHDAVTAVFNHLPLLRERQCQLGVYFDAQNLEKLRGDPQTATLTRLGRRVSCPE
ncbi:hypothetical protein IEO21_02548 [Rhodonia placenta]|uniref:F-box domain-containing protein n=1 Tax=Rhodonia placenta TaxID=104341 RepID=A0A8H7P7B1_9APHY|nr:hypothetical protein IEO21_02548 [Postia placenta]